MSQSPTSSREGKPPDLPMKSDRSKGKPGFANEPGPSHTQTKRPAKPSTDDEDWECRRCDSRNTAEDLRCRRPGCKMTKIINTSWDSITALPLSAADMRKSWHKDCTQRRRDTEVRSLVRDMSTVHPAEDIKDLLTEAQNIERDIFKSANSKWAYERLVGEKWSELWVKRMSIEMKQSGQMEMKSMDQTSTPPLPPGHKIHQAPASERKPSYFRNEPGPSHTKLFSIRALPLSAAEMKKSWHEDFPQYLSTFNVQELVGVMSTGDPAEDSDLVTDAQKIEREAYESANSKGEYEHLVSEKISELMKKSQMSREMKQSGQMDMKSMDQISTPPLPPGDKKGNVSGDGEPVDTASSSSSSPFMSFSEDEEEEQGGSTPLSVACDDNDVSEECNQETVKMEMEMKSMDQTLTPPIPPGHKVPPHVVSGTLLKEVSNVKQKGSLTSYSSTAEGVKLIEMEHTQPEKKDLDEERDMNMSLRGRGKHTRKLKHSEMEDTPEETKQLDEDRDRRRMKHATEMLEWMLDLPFTPGDNNPPIQSQSQPQISPLNPSKHHSITGTPSPSPSTSSDSTLSSEMEDMPEETKQLDEERDRRRVKPATEMPEWTLFGPPCTPSDNTSSDSTLSRPHMVSPQRPQHRKRSKEELEESNHPSSTLPLLPSSTLSTSLHTTSTQVLPLPRKRRKAAEIEESDIPSSQDVPPQVMLGVPNMYPVATISPMLSSSSTSQQSFQHSQEEIMSCDTHLSTTDHAITEPLSSVDHSLELQYETDLFYSDCKMGESISLPRSQSLPSLIPCLENKTGFRAKRSHSVNYVTLLGKSQRFTPDIIVVENQESYRFHSTQAGLFQCSVTDLVFKMKAEGDVTYRTVPWHRGLLSQVGKRPAGPLFDINASQRSVSQLRFPHCEILSAGGGRSLSVVHVKDDGHIELIKPLVITETHVNIDVTGFSLYGVVTDVNSTDPIRAYMSLFYTPPIDDEDDVPTSNLNVLLLPGTVVLEEVKTKRRKLYGEEIYIGKPPRELIPKKEYSLSTSPQDDVTIEPNKARFEVDESSYHNFDSTFEVTLEKKFKRVELFLKDSNTFVSAWESHVNFSAPAIRRHQVKHTLRLSAEERLFTVRSGFIDRVSLPNLNSLVDKLFERSVINDAEREMADGMQIRNHKARFVIDTVRHKGPEASSTMILILCGLDTLLSEHLGLM